MGAASSKHAMTIVNTTCTGRLSLSLTSSMTAPHQSKTFKSEDWPSFFASCDVRMSGMCQCKMMDVRKIKQILCKLAEGQPPPNQERLMTSIKSSLSRDDAD